jgi:hypothetical protein
MHVDARNDAGYLRAMNAVVRRNHEVSMLTNEAIEAHLAALHKGHDELREDVCVLRAGQDSLRQRVETINESLSQSIAAVNTSLSAKIDSMNTRLSDKISKLSDDVAEMRGMQKAMLWVVSGLGSLGFIGKIFHWF